MVTVVSKPLPLHVLSVTMGVPSTLSPLSTSYVSYGSASGSPVERNLRINFPELRSSPAILYSSNGLWRTCWQAYGGWTADLTIIYSVRRFVMGYVLPTEHVFASLLRVSSWRHARKLIRLLDHLDDNNTFAIIF